MPTGASSAPRGILELDRFSEASLRRWAAISRDLDVLQSELFFGLEPERRNLRGELVATLRRSAPVNMSFQRWVRIVTYAHSDKPLSCAGSLQGIGGRFNAGADLDDHTFNPWPALYLAEDHETAFREKFQLPSDGRVGGLTPQELALEHGVSHATVFVRGHLTRVFDIAGPESLTAVASVFKRIKMPARAREIRRRLNIPNSGLRMVQTGQHLYDGVLVHNWRMAPIQFGLPAPGQILAELIRSAGFEAIRYRSTQGAGKCIAAFPDLITDASFVELVDASPESVEHRRLDASTAPNLEGWQSLPRRMRARR